MSSKPHEPLERARFWIGVVDDAEKHADKEFSVADAVAIAQVYATLAQVEQLSRLSKTLDRIYDVYLRRRA